MSVSWTQLLLGGLSGVLLTFILARGLDISRNRPNLRVQLGETRERLYVRDVGEGGNTRLVVCEPTDPSAQLVITLDLLCINQSFQPDALIGASLVSPLSARGRVRADEPFTGVNVSPHSITPVRFRFFLSKVANAGQQGYGNIPIWSEDPLPNLVLAVDTVRRRSGPFASKSTRELTVEGGLIRRSHREGVGTLEIHYLTKSPPSGTSAPRRSGVTAKVRQSWTSMWAGLRRGSRTRV